ncbi:MAG: DJ-1/PfpI family protein [Oscillospiraceae bacterium]|nr:DJ-1/PfpI family protein [Oscillospiraceae bacterium]
MIYVFLAEGFEETEAITPIDMLRRCGKEVVTVGVTGKVVTGSHNIPVTCDITLSETKTEGLEMIVLPGGMPGTKNLAASPRVSEIIKHCAKNDILIGAICAAPSILGEMGLLNGRKAVCYPGFEDALKGAEVLFVPAVRDGNFITARGAGAAPEFSYELISALIDENTAEKLAGNIVWKK